jgi:mannose-6-phosphate isomerase-like protein (cupin superfamily)
MSGGQTRNDDGPDPLDAMAAAPEHHRVLLENDRVRVLDAYVAPGEETPVHTHRWPSVLYVVTSSHFVRYEPDGSVSVDSRMLASKPENGAVLWTPPLGPHFVRNVGEQELRVIAVEVKSTQQAGKPKS